MRFDPEEVNVGLWMGRIHAAQVLSDQEMEIWRKIERAVDGAFPALIESDDSSAWAGTPLDGRFRSGDQLDVNLMGRALRRKIAESFDRYPTLSFTKRPTTDMDVADEMIRLAGKLMEEGDALHSCRRGMEQAYTRGVDVLWPLFLRDRAMESEIVAAKTPPAQYVESVMHGNPPYVPIGADYDGILAALKMVLEPFNEQGQPNPTYFQLTEVQKNDLVTLQIRAERASRKKREAPKTWLLRSKLNYECTPYGTFCLVDSTVTDFSKVTWIARLIPMSPEEFQLDPAFTDEAKANISPKPLPQQDGGVPVAPNPPAKPDNRKTADMLGRVNVWEIWDKIGQRRIYLADGYDKPVGKTTRYPYMDMYGRPLFTDFFPCVWRTPWSRQVETASRVLGLPGLEPMWGPQIEYIKTLSAYVIACKSAARIFLVGPNIDPNTLNAVSKARDGSYVKFAANAPTTGTDIAKEFVRLDMAPAPLDFLSAAEKVKAEAYESVHLTSSGMTGAPQAGTASQEAMIGQGASTVAGDVRSTFQDGYAELAFKSLLMFLEFANDQEFEAYLGKEALEPRPALDPTPVMDPATGEQVPPPPRPSIVQAMRETDLIGERMEARFASSVDNEDYLRIKTLEDVLAVISNVRDGAGMPYADVLPIIKQVLREADVEYAPYHPSEGEIAIQVAAAAGNRGIAPGGGDDGDGADSEGEGDDDQHDTRKAGGERGKPASPGRHTRGQQAAGAHANGLRMAHTVNP